MFRVIFSLKNHLQRGRLSFDPGPHRDGERSPLFALCHRTSHVLLTFKWARRNTLLSKEGTDQPPLSKQASLFNQRNSYQAVDLCSCGSQTYPLHFKHDSKGSYNIFPDCIGNFFRCCSVPDQLHFWKRKFSWHVSLGTYSCFSSLVSHQIPPLRTMGSCLCQT